MNIKAGNAYLLLALFSAGLIATVVQAAPPGPALVVPPGGSPPGGFPNTSIAAINVVAKGTNTDTGAATLADYEGQSPVRWTVSKYNRGDYSMRLAPADPAAADAATLNQGYISYDPVAPNDASSAPNQAWRPDPARGITIPTVRQNGPINWGDGQGDTYPTVAINALGASGKGYSMVDGTFGTGQLDVNTGRAGTHVATPEANFSFSVSWFPYDAGWIGGNFGNPDSVTGVSAWAGVDQHSAGLIPGVMKWEPAPLTGQYEGLGMLRLPGIDALNDGMIFCTSSDGGSDVNIVGVAPVANPDSSTGWLVTIREDSALVTDEVATNSQSEFQFVYVPYNAPGLIGGYIDGATGNVNTNVGTFTLTRTGIGAYELTIPGKTATSGTLLLQVAEQDFSASAAMASRAFLSYQFNTNTGKFLIQSRTTTTDAVSDLVDAGFYFAWVDFANPMTAPAGPRLRARSQVTVVDATTIDALAEANIAVNTDEPEILVTTIDLGNGSTPNAYTDSTTGNPATSALLGYFYDPRTLVKTRGPFVIMANEFGFFRRHDVKYNPVSKQYNVVGNARNPGNGGVNDLVMISIINPNSVAGVGDPRVTSFRYDGVTNGAAYDDVSLAVSVKNGNFIIACEHKFAGEGEGTVGALFSSNGTVLTPTATRLDKLQPTGDEDDPDVVYLPQKNVFAYIANTDLAGNVVDSVAVSFIQTVPSGGNLTVTTEQVVAPSWTHPSVIENPFNGSLIFEVGGASGNNLQLNGFSVGAGPSYTISSNLPTQGAYSSSQLGLAQHGQMAADPDSGVIVLGHYINGNGSPQRPHSYGYQLLNTNGVLSSTQFKGPQYLIESAVGQTDNNPNYHNLKYDPFSDSIIVVQCSGGAGNRAVYLAALQVTTDYLPAPTLTITPSGSNVIIRWPAIAAHYSLKFTSSLSTPTWSTVTGATQNDALMEITIPAAGAAFYRLEK